MIPLLYQLSYPARNKDVLLLFLRFASKTTSQLGRASQVNLLLRQKWWTGQDLNLRTLTRADLQSAAIDHSATCP